MPQESFKNIDVQNDYQDALNAFRIANCGVAKLLLDGVAPTHPDVSYASEHAEELGIHLHKIRSSAAITEEHRFARPT